MSLDSFDRKLLAAVQKTNQLNADALGGTVGLSPFPCLRRPRDSGVIEPEVAMAAPENGGAEPHDGGFVHRRIYEGWPEPM